MRVVGTRHWSEIVRDPGEAYRRGRRLDAMLRAAMPPVARGVMRGTHEYFNRLDDARAARAARAIDHGRRV